MSVTYETKFRLEMAVKDLDKAQKYLAESELMTSVLRERMQRYFDPSVIERIDWCLEEPDNGVIRLQTSEPLDEEQLAKVSEWVSGQNSDGLGEGFEQQDFACYCYCPVTDDDGSYEMCAYCEIAERGECEGDQLEEVMASFDWRHNDYSFSEV